MTTPLSKARKYKVTFAGPRYSLGTMIRIDGQWLVISHSKCDLTLRKSANGQTFHQFQWIYILPRRGDFSELQFIEADMKLFEEKGDLRHATTEQS